MLPGEYSDNGVRLSNWPIFKNPFRFWGEDTSASKDVEPSAVWKYNPSTSNVYAVLAQNISAYLNIDFRYISFKDWIGVDPQNPASNAGGIVVWNPGQYAVDRCWFKNLSIGFTHRFSYAKITNCRFEDAYTFAVGTQYSATSNTGTQGNGNIFIRAGVLVGRYGVLYLTDNDFDGADACVTAQYKSRVNTVNNRYSNWLRCVYWMQGVSFNTGSQGDQYLTAPTRERPILINDVASIHRDLHRGVARTVQAYSNSLKSITGKSGQRLLLSEELQDSGYTPFRLPGWTLYSNQWRLEVELRMTFNNGAGGKLELSGQTANSTGVLAEATIPNMTGGGSGHQVIRITVLPQGASGSYGLVESRLLPVGSYPRSVSVLPDTVASNTENERLFRLYFTPSSDETVTFVSVRSWFEG